MVQRAQSSILIDADPGTVLDVIADLESYPEWIPGMTSVHVLEDNDGWPDRAELTLDAGVITDTYVLDYIWDVEEDSTGVVSWSLVRGSMLTVMDGSYTLEHVGEDATNVTDRLSVDVNVPLLASVKRKAEETIIESALNGLKARAEREGGGS